MPAAGASWLTFVVVGAGPTGVELAGQIAELARGRCTTTSAASIRPRPGSCSSTPARRFSAAYPVSLQRRAARGLERLGVEIRLGAWSQASIHEGSTPMSSERQVQRLDAATRIWAAGVEGSPLGRMVAEAAGAGWIAPDG